MSKWQKKNMSLLCEEIKPHSQAQFETLKRSLLDFTITSQHLKISFKIAQVKSIFIASLDFDPLQKNLNIQKRVSNTTQPLVEQT